MKAYKELVALATEGKEEVIVSTLDQAADRTELGEISRPDQSKTSPLILTTIRAPAG